MRGVHTLDVLLDRLSARETHLSISVASSEDYKNHQRSERAGSTFAEAVKIFSKTLQFFRYSYPKVAADLLAVLLQLLILSILMRQIGEKGQKVPLCQRSK